MHCYAILSPLWSPNVSVAAERFQIALATTTTKTTRVLECLIFNKKRRTKNLVDTRPCSSKAAFNIECKKMFRGLEERTITIKN